MVFSTTGAVLVPSTTATTTLPCLEVEVETTY